jgi:hypothetical protein
VLKKFGDVPEDQKRLLKAAKLSLNDGAPPQIPFGHRNLNSRSKQPGLAIIVPLQEPAVWDFFRWAFQKPEPSASPAAQS